MEVTEGHQQAGPDAGSPVPGDPAVMQGGPDEPGGRSPPPSTALWGSAHHTGQPGGEVPAPQD